MAAHLVDPFRLLIFRARLEPAEERSDDAGLDGLLRWLDLTPQFQTFLDIFTNPDSYNKGAWALGSADPASPWQSSSPTGRRGDITDLQGGLDATAKQINVPRAQASAP